MWSDSATEEQENNVGPAFKCHVCMEHSARNINRIWQKTVIESAQSVGKNMVQNEEYKAQ